MSTVLGLTQVAANLDDTRGILPFKLASSVNDDAVAVAVNPVADEAAGAKPSPSLQVVNPASAS
jgi:hypothetical protein